MCETLQTEGGNQIYSLKISVFSLFNWLFSFHHLNCIRIDIVFLLTYFFVLTLRRPSRQAWRSGLFYGAPRPHLHPAQKRPIAKSRELQYLRIWNLKDPHRIFHKKIIKILQILSLIVFQYIILNLYPKFGSNRFIGSRDFAMGLFWAGCTCKFFDHIFQWSKNVRIFQENRCTAYRFLDEGWPMSF